MEGLLDTFAPARSLFERCVAGDERAWRELYREFQPLVVRFLRRLALSPLEVEEASQEVFLQVFRYLGRFEHRADFKTWLYKLCVTQASRLRRRFRMWAVLTGILREQKGADLFIAEAADPADKQAALHALISMKPQHRHVFVLFELEGLSGEEIARVVGCPVATVWSRLHYARKEFLALGMGTTGDGFDASGPLQTLTSRQRAETES